jgi:hypothetical protein
MTEPFQMVEKAIRELIETRYPVAEGKVGGDLDFTSGQGAFYVFIGLVDGSTDQIEGEWIVDIDVLADRYSQAMQTSLALEAILVGPRHVTPTMRIDNCYQNQAPHELPWDDESSYRVGGTYVFTARRPSSA